MRSLLICHHDAPLDVEGLAPWLSSFSELSGVVVIHEPADRVRRRVEREVRRVGRLRFADVLAFRLYYKALLSRSDRAWERRKLDELRARFPGPFRAPLLHVSDPNGADVASFIAAQQPDVVVARCKTILKKSIFTIPQTGTFVIHPGICPEYRNAHGCFWAIARGDVDKVGATLLRIDEGVDTGPAFGYFRYDYDPAKESHVVIQHRAVLDNLDAIRDRLLAIHRGVATPLDTRGRASATWGQPWLTSYLRYRYRARTARPQARSVA